MSKDLRDILLNKPLMIEPRFADSIVSKLSDGSNAFFGFEPMTESRNFNVLEGIAIIPVMGMLVHRARESFFTVTSYQVLAEKISAAAEDDSIHSILLDIDSGGGEVEGLLDLAEFIADISANVKPVFAISNGAAFSAAYAIAVSADQLFVTRTSGVGSIGVITQHFDFSKQNEMIGLKVTPVFAGAFKIDRSPDFPISDAAIERIRVEIDAAYDLFVNHVGTMNPALGAQGARNTEAGLFFGDNAVSSKLASKVLNFDDTINLILEHNDDSFMTGTSDIKIGKGDEMKLFADSNKDSEAKAEASEDAVKKEAEDVAPKLEVEQGEDPVKETVDEPQVEQAEDVIKEAVAEDKPDEIVEEKSELDVNAIAAHCAEINTLAMSAGSPEMAHDMIKQMMPIEDVKAELDVAGKIKGYCDLAGKPKLAAKFIAKEMSIEEVQAKLIETLAKEDDKIEISDKVDVNAIDNDQVKSYASQDSETNLLQLDADRRANK